MLRSFRFANHRSFQDEQELSLLPAYDKADRSVVPVAAVYGANASGKSNVLDAFRFMAEAVRDSYAGWDPAAGVPRRPFRLAPEGFTEPSWYAVDVLVEGVRYEYGFGVDDDRVVEEWLHSYPQRKKRVLFARKGDEISFGPSVGGSKASLPAMTRPSALMLSVAAQTGVESLLAVYRWFRQAVQMVDLSAGLPPLPSPESYRALAAASPDRSSRLIELLRAADLGISGLQLPSGSLVELDTAMLWEIYGRMRGLLPDRRPKSSEAFVRELEKMSAEEIAEIMQGIHDRVSSPAELRLLHGDVALPMEEESAGTRGWLALLWVALPVLDEGGVLVVDELDSRLHPLLTARLLGLFHSADTNPQGAQLIFAAHDTSLLGTSLSRETLRRDEVWFVEKDATGASKLFPLTQFRPRNGENPERRYLGGSYGAVPFLDDEVFGEPGGSVPA